MKGNPVTILAVSIPSFMGGASNSWNKTSTTGL